MQKAKLANSARSFAVNIQTYVNNAIETTDHAHFTNIDKFVSKCVVWY